MAREAFLRKTFYATSRKIIRQANEILDEYRAQGYILTLRQLYYQFVSRDLIENTQQSYKRLGQVINDARLAGFIDWASIEDLTRQLADKGGFDNTQDFMDSVMDGYCLDHWADQDYRVEVWVEKQALTRIVSKACSALNLPYFACRGYVSQSEQYKAGKRMAWYREQGKQPIILHLGDHDPSGIDMTRDNDDRLTMFARSRGATMVRIALNMDQIEKYKPPPNPAVTTDSRYGAYIAAYGHDSWELDALKPPVMEALIHDTAQTYIDQDKWDVVADREERERVALVECGDRWPDVQKYLAQPLPPEPDPTRQRVIDAFRRASGK